MPHAVEKDPELAIQMGRVAAYSSHLEFMIDGLFAQCAGLDRSISYAITSNLPNTRLKREIVAHLAQVTLPPDSPKLRKIRSLLRRARKLASQRNTIIHSTIGWLPEDEKPHQLLYNKERTLDEPLHARQPLDTKEMGALATHLEKLVDDFVNFMRPPISLPERPGGLFGRLLQGSDPTPIPPEEP